MTQRNIVEAINSALAEEMEADPRVMVLGLDVGKLGGVFRTTSGLVERFGSDRVVDTPLAEASIIGASLGLAIAGMVPVAEIQFLGFTAQGFHQPTGCTGPADPKSPTAATPCRSERRRWCGRESTSRWWRGAQPSSCA